MREYRYAFDTSGRSFTESNWITRAWEHFVRLDEDSDATFALFLVSVFAGHLRDGSIIAVDAEDRYGRNADDESSACPFCHERYAGQRLDYPCSDASKTVMCLRRNAYKTRTK